MFSSPIGRVRVVGILEAVSFLALLGIGLPLKYMLGMPIAVKVFGPIHGALFIGLCMSILRAREEAGWSMGRASWLMFVALLPAGPLFVDPGLKREQAAARQTAV